MLLCVHTIVLLVHYMHLGAGGHSLSFIKRTKADKNLKF